MCGRFPLETAVPPRRKTPKPKPKQRTIKINAWCEMHDVSRAAAYDLMRRGLLKYVVFGSTRRIVLEELTPEN
jgi:hypothetical protein